MSGNLGDNLAALFGLVMAILVACAIAQQRTHDDIMQQAFDRGYAVQCIGKTGYHWECGE